MDKFFDKNFKDYISKDMYNIYFNIPFISWYYKTNHNFKR